MANVRDLTRKIGSLQNMQKVMRAMNMIASTKFKKISYLQDSLKAFNENLLVIENDITSSFTTSRSPFINGFDNVKKIEIIMFTADRGLCGSHNSSINKAVAMMVKKKKNDGIESEITSLGNKGTVFARRNDFKIYHHSEISEKTLNDQALRDLSKALMDRFANGEINEIYLLYNEFVSTLVQNTKIVSLFPFNLQTKEKNIKKIEINTEPEESEFLKQSVKALFNYKLKVALLNSYISEHSARMTAMDNATNNSEDLIHRYAKLKNKARQTTITNELIEIVAGKEALK